MAAGLHDVVRRRSVNRITSKLTGAFEYRAQLRECVEGAMIPPPESRPCGPVASITMPKGPSRETKTTYAMLRRPMRAAHSRTRSTEFPLAARPSQIEQHLGLAQ